MLYSFAARVVRAAVRLVSFLSYEGGWPVAPVCHFKGSYVDPALRGTGAGRALIQACEAAARARSAPKLYWHTQSDNATARLLYDRLAKYSGYIRYEYPI